MSKPYPESSQSVEKQATDISKTDPRDHVVYVIKAALNAVPLVGGVLSSLIDDYIPRRKEERLFGFVKLLKDDLTRVAAEVNQKYLKSDEFCFLFEQACRAATQNYREETLCILSHIVAISAVRFDVAQNVKEEFLRIASTMQPMHIRVLSFLADPSNRNQFQCRKTEFPLRSYRDGIAAPIIAYCLPDVDVSDEIVVPAILSFLTANGLITNPYLKKDLLTIHEFEECITPFGKQFLAFLSNSELSSG